VIIHAWWSLARARPERRVPSHFSVRLGGFDSPEMRRKKAGRTEESRQREKRDAVAARDALAGLIAANGGRVTLDCRGADKYGRLLAWAYCGATDVCAWMIAHGYGVAYDGGHKTPFG
jgi:endonuclease YncB( thermonuclease family)